MLKHVMLLVILVITPLQAAWADGGHRRDHRWHHRHHHPRPHFFLHHWGPHYYRPYHRPTRVIYTSPPVQREIVYIQPTPLAREQDRYCREYQSVSRIGGYSRQTYGTACLQPDGSWEIDS